MSAYLGRRVAVEGRGLETGPAEVVGHEMGVRLGDAEAERAHGAGVGDLVPDLLDDDAGSRVVRRQEIAQLLIGVRTLLPGQVREVGPVRDAEVVEGRQQVVLQGFPKPHLGGDATIEELVLDIESVHPLRGGGESQQLLRREVFDHPAVRTGRGVVELVDDDDVEMVWSQLLQPLDVE